MIGNTLKIGVLTGGGDCPGLNPAIRAVVRRADQYGYSVVGIYNGWAGLLGEGNVAPLGLRDVSGILTLGGTMLGTSRTNPFRNPDQVQQVIDNLRRHEIDALIAIGGDDTLSVASRLVQLEQKVVGIPKTMDNDVSGTDFTIGFNSAVTVVMDALDRLHTTASSHHRVLVVEVMGREAGWVAVVGGLAGGADFILIPERPTSIETVCKHLERRRTMGKDFSIIVIAEGAVIPDIGVDAADGVTDAFGHVRLDRRNIGELFGREIERRTGFETRITVLGHVQRGGSPTLFDRVMATRYGVAAVDYIREGRFGFMPALRGTKIVPCRISDAVSVNRTVDLDLYELAQIFY